jgi:hypothetical protein
MKGITKRHRRLHCPGLRSSFWKREIVADCEVTSREGLCRRKERNYILFADKPGVTLCWLIKRCFRIGKKSCFLTKSSPTEGTRIARIQPCGSPAIHRSASEDRRGIHPY